jgi:subtilisin family serine protease
MTPGPSINKGRLHATLKSNLNLPRAYVFNVDSGISIPEAVKILKQDPDVEFAQPNYVYHPSTSPCDAGNNCDTEFWRQYGLQNTGQTFYPGHAGTSGADIGATRAWDFTTGSRSVIVSIIDSGVDYMREDLAANTWNPNEASTPQINDLHGWDFRNNDNDPINHYTGASFQVIPWHGTHVAGIIGAEGSNGVGVCGVAWRVTLLPCKCSDDGGSDVYTDAASNAIYYSIAAGARIINNSWGDYSLGNDQCLQAALQAANAAGIIVVCGAGNDRRDTDVSPFYPAGYNFANIVAVAASDENDGVADFDEHHGTNWGHSSVDLAAPGARIFSTMPLNGDGDLYAFASGTSMAAPHVSGAFALLLSYFPSMTAQEAINRVMQYADPVPSWANKTVSGRRLNIGRAILGQDLAPPAAVTDLAIGTVSSNWVELHWSSPSDNGFLKHPKSYDLRYSTQPINASNFASATPFPLPEPSAAGAQESFHVTGLDLSREYFFALKSADEVTPPGASTEPNISSLSNVVSATTLGAPAALESPNPANATLLTGANTDITFQLQNTASGGLDFSIGSLNVPWASLDFGLGSGNGTVVPGQYFLWTVHLDATGLPAGLNTASFSIETNDPNRPLVIVNINLSVTSAPDIAVNSSAYEFVPVFVGHSRTTAFQIANPGTETLQVSASTSNPQYQVSVGQLTVPPGDTGEISVTYSPSSTTGSNATLDLTTNDPDESQVNIPLVGNVLNVSVSPSAVSQTVCTGDQASQNVSISNQSNVPVTYEIRSAAGSTPSLSTPETPLTGMKILIDATHTPTWTAYPALFIDLIAHAGGNSAVLDVVADELTPALLRDHQIFFLPLSYVPWTEQARTAVADWVRAGGTLLLTGRGVDGAESNFDQLCNALGANIDLTSDSVPWREETNSFAEHPIALHPLGLRYVLPGDSFGFFSSVAAPAHPLVWDSTEQHSPVAAYAEIGKGRIVALAGDYFFRGGTASPEPIQQAENLAFVRNIFSWLADAVWLASSPMNGTIAPQSTGALNLILDASKLSSGNYARDLVVQITDPDTKEFVVPVSFAVGIPDIQGPTSAVAFGNVSLATSKTKQVTISNTGSCTLNVNTMDFLNGVYFTWAGPGSSFQPVQIAPGANFVFTLRFTPQVQGVVTDTLTVGSDDPDENPVIIKLQGKGFGYSLSADVPIGASGEIVIKNDGVSDLRWHLIGERAEVSPVGGYMLSDTAPAQMVRTSTEPLEGVRELRDLSNAQIAYMGNLPSTISKDLKSRGARLTPIDQSLKGVENYSTLWIAGNATLRPGIGDALANWVLDGGALVFEGSLPFDGIDAEKIIGWERPEAVLSDGASKQFGEWLEFGSGAIIRLDAGASNDSELEDASRRLAANHALDWLIPADWLSFETEVGVTSPGTSTSVKVGPGSLRLPAGDHDLEVTVYTDDPNHPRISIPVRLTILANETSSLPVIHALRQSSPNPMFSSTQIGFDLPFNEHVQIEVFDLQGRSVKTLIDQEMPAGRQQVQWNGQRGGGNRVNPGVYFYRIKTPSFKAVRKLVVAQ